MRKNTPFRVVFWGKPCGKTQLLEAILWDKKGEQPFSDLYIPTIGVDFKLKDLGDGLQLQIWDTSGQERFETITKSFIRGENAIVFCIDLTLPTGEFKTEIDRLTKFIENEIKNSASHENTKIIFVGTKADGERDTDPRLIEDNFLTLTTDNEYPCYKTSARSHTGIDDLNEQLKADAEAFSTHHMPNTARYFSKKTGTPIVTPPDKKGEKLTEEDKTWVWWKKLKYGAALIGVSLFFIALFTLPLFYLSIAASIITLLTVSIPFLSLAFSKSTRLFKLVTRARMFSAVAIAALFIGAIFAPILYIPTIAWSIIVLTYEPVLHLLNSLFESIKHSGMKNDEQSPEEEKFSKRTPSFTVASLIASIFISLGIAIALLPTIFVMAGISATFMTNTFIFGGAVLSISQSFIIAGALLAGITALFHFIHFGFILKESHPLYKKWKQTGAARFIMGGAITAGVVSILGGLVVAGGGALTGLSLGLVVGGAAFVVASIIAHVWHILTRNPGEPASQDYFSHSAPRSLASVLMGQESKLRTRGKNGNIVPMGSQMDDTSSDEDLKAQAARGQSAPQERPLPTNSEKTILDRGQEPAAADSQARLAKLVGKVGMDYSRVGAHTGVNTSALSLS